MNRSLVLRILAPLSLSILSVPAGGQERKAQDQPGTIVLNQHLLLSQAELVLEQVPVRNVDPMDLFQVAHDLVGRSYVVKENIPAKPQSNLRMIGTTILVYDTKEQVQRVRELLAKLDVERPEDASSSWDTVEYKPRFVSLETVVATVKNVVDEYGPVEERGLVVLRGRHEGMKTAQALLKRIDVPQRQVLLTCQLVEYGDSAHGLALPRDLADNLEKLLHVGSFAQVGMAMLRTSVSSAMPVTLQVESPGKRYLFSFTPVAFDEASGSLSVSNCSLIEQADKEARELFRTNAVLSSSEYTVLAATGATPRLLVVRVTPQG